MEEIIKGEELEQFVTQLHEKDQPKEIIFEQAVSTLEISEISLLLEALPIDERCQFWIQVPDELKAQVLAAMRSQARDPIIEAMDNFALKLLLQSLDAESLIELVDNLSDEQIEQAYRLLDDKQRVWFEGASQYEVSQIGRYVDHEIISIPTNAKVRDALRAIKRSLAVSMDYVFLIDNKGVYRGAVQTRDVLREKDPLRMARGLIDESVTTINADEELLEAADIKEKNGASSLPVIDAEGILIGIMTSVISLSIYKENYEKRLMSQAGLKEETDLFVPIKKGAQERAVWLGINLLTAFLASWTIGLFENVLSEIVALAVLMPVVASMGGISGSQTLTLIIRGLATGQVTMGNALPLCKQEIGIALINGIGWAVVIGIVSMYWFGSIEIGFVISVAVFANIIAASISGVYLPVLLDRFGIDPALSGAVLLTTVTDVFGFVAFLGLGTLLLL